MKARQLWLAQVRRRPEPERRHGGARRGAGRKAKDGPLPGGKKREVHGVRPFLEARHPVHVVLRLTPEVGWLRRRSAYQAMRRALITSLGREDFRVVHISIQGHHIHLLCEAEDRMALSNGVRGLCVSAAHRLNAAIAHDRRLPQRRRGRVFVDRYHAEQIKSPTQSRSALAYVLNNWRRHREDRGAARWAKVDRYASAVAFPGWAGREQVPFPWPRGYEPLPVAYPHTWMLREGWKRAGPIGLHAVPGPRPPPAMTARRD